MNPSSSFYSTGCLESQIGMIIEPRITLPYITNKFYHEWWDKTVQPKKNHAPPPYSQDYITSPIFQFNFLFKKSYIPVSHYKGVYIRTYVTKYS